MKFKKFISTEKASKQIADEIVGNEKQYKYKSLVIIGDTENPSNSIIEGYVRTPNKKIVKHLLQIANVLKINEFRINKLCS